MLAAGLFLLLRQLERWLHQHIFKVGWLVTKSFQTTTILYYTFFLPGVFLHEVSYWLAAGILNVHAKSSIQWPEAQEIAELKLSFVELEKTVTPFQLGLITLAPILTGLGAVWFIGSNILDFNQFFALISTGSLPDLSDGVHFLTSRPDFWLWTYILFTIGNTMISRLQDLRGLRILLIAVGLLTAALILVGVGNQVVVTALIGPVSEALNLLSGTFVVVIFIDLIFLVILGTLESVIERITGDSAMFRRGKLIAMTRQEMLEQRQRQSRREARALQAKTTTASRPSIYTFSLAIPGPPGEEPVTQSGAVIVEPDERPVLRTATPRDDRRGPDMIAGAVTGRSTTATPALIASSVDNDEDDDESDETETPSLATMSRIPDEDDDEQEESLDEIDDEPEDAPEH